MLAIIFGLYTALILGAFFFIDRHTDRVAFVFFAACVFILVREVSILREARRRRRVQKQAFEHAKQHMLRKLGQPDKKA